MNTEDIQPLEAIGVGTVFALNTVSYHEQLLAVASTVFDSLLLAFEK